MQSEGINLSRNKIADLVVESATLRDIEIGPIEADLIAKIINQSPININANNLRRWCDNIVSDEIEKYPLLQEKSKIIRNDVWKELRYFLDKSDFEYVLSRLKIEKSTKVTPNYLYKNFPPFYKKIKRYYKKLDGNIDWDFIGSKLNINIEYETIPDYGSMESIVQTPVSILEKENPQTLNIHWIRNNHYNLYTAIFQRFKDVERGPINWDKLKELLPEIWKNKFEIRGFSIFDVSERFSAYVKDQDIKEVSPNTLIRFSKKDYILLQKKLPRDQMSNIRWQVFVDLLPQEIAGRWFKRRRANEVMPENQYRDEKELYSELKTLKDYFYLFYVPISSEEEKTKRSDLVERMRKLSIKGNIMAYEKLADHLFFMLQEKIENEPKLQNWKYATDDLNKLIRSCIYLHDPSKGDFFKYLNTSVYKKVRSLNDLIKNKKGNGIIKISRRGDFYEEE